MRAVLIALFVLVLAVAGVFLGQFFLNPAVISPTGLFSGDGSEGGLITINSTICKDTAGPKVKLEVTPSYFPFDLKGYVCDPLILFDTEGVGLRQGMKANVSVNGNSIGSYPVNPQTGLFTVNDFHEKLISGDNVNFPWTVSVTVKDALGNSETVETQLVKTGTTSVYKRTCAGGHWGTKTLSLSQPTYSNRLRVGMAFSLCSINPGGGCESGEGGDDAVFRVFDPSGSRIYSSGGYCCCGGLDCSNCGRNTNWHYRNVWDEYDVHEVQTFKTIMNPSGCGGSWEKHDGLSCFSVTVYRNDYEFEYVPSDYDPDCADVQIAECNKDFFCTGYDAGRCDSNCDSFCEGDIAYTSTLCSMMDDVPGCDQYCTCYDTVNCSQTNQVCQKDGLFVSCVDPAGCNSDCVDQGYDGGACGFETDYPKCADMDSSKKLTYADTIDNSQCTTNNCICYTEESCGSGEECIEGECTSCVSQGESCSDTSECCSGLSCVEGECDIPFDPCQGEGFKCGAGLDCCLSLTCDTTINRCVDCNYEECTSGSCDSGYKCVDSTECGKEICVPCEDTFNEGCLFKPCCDGLTCNTENTCV